MNWRLAKPGSARLPKKATWIVFVVMTIMQTGCGFTLRGSHQMPDSLKVMYLDPSDKYSELASLLKMQLQLNDIELVKNRLNGNETRPVAVLNLDRDRLDRRTLSLFPNGQVAEYELIYSVRYSIQLPDQDPQPFDFEIYRDYHDDPESALAKSKELKLILKEMRRRAADKIIRQLSSLNNQPKQGL